MIAALVYVLVGIVFVRWALTYHKPHHTPPGILIGLANVVLWPFGVIYLLHGIYTIVASDGQRRH